MKLYLISQNVNTNYDTYDLCVVAAESEYEAKRIPPSSSDPRAGEDGKFKKTGVYGDWAENVDQVMCQYLGEAKEGTTPGIICASFNAG